MFYLIKSMKPTGLFSAKLKLVYLIDTGDSKIQGILELHVLLFRSVYLGHGVSIWVM